MADSISAIPQQPQLGRIAQFLRYLETQNAPEFLPKQLDVMGLIRQLALPSASTVENLSYGNSPFTMPPQGTGAMIPQVKTGRKPEVADLVGMLGGVPGVGALSDVGTKLSNEAADAIVRAITGNPQATAPQVIRETSMPFMQAVAPRTPGLLETPVKSDLGFYSALEQATIPLQNKGTGTQFLAQIEKTAGVKHEEIKWTGLDEFLKSKPNVSKQEVQNYLAANRVNLQEVRLGGATSPYPYRTANEWQGAIDRAEAAGNWDEAANINQAWEAAEGFGPAGSPKFSQYTLPGGENYREILLTLPIQPKGTNRYEVRSRKTPGESSVFDTEANKVIMFGRDAGMYQEAERLNRELAGTQLFKSSHFDQPNILAHMRVNDRVVDGKKTLFIEEIQSDWHQAGRKKGYQREKDLTPEQIDLKFIQSEIPPGADPSVYPGYYEAFDKNTGQFLGRHSGTLNREQAMRDAVMSANQFQTGVPNAPFKTTWHELSLKRAIQEASEKGYDQIAFTTGKTQAERYDLSKQISKLSAQHLGAGRYRVDAIDKNGKPAVMKITENEDELEGLIGKEFSKKIIEDTKNKTVGKTYSGLDLQVGGEGMKGFYDNILPKSLDKLGKKFDAKVGKTEMDGVEVWAMDITPKMRESVLTKGQPLFAATPAIPAAGLLGDEGE
jgi:hypothetical protein